MAPSYRPLAIPDGSAEYSLPDAVVLHLSDEGRNPSNRADFREARITGLWAEDELSVRFGLGERVLDLETSEPREVAIGRAEVRAVLDGECGELRIHHEGATCLAR